MAAVTRVKLGKVGAGTADYGLEIYNSSGAKMLGLTGAETVGFIANAVSVGAEYSNDATITVTFGDSETEIGTVTISTNGGFVAVWGRAFLDVNNVGGTLTLRLRKDSLTGTILATIDSRSDFDNPLLLGFDSSPASSQTYKLSAVYTAGTTGDAKDIKYRRMLAINLKK